MGKDKDKNNDDLTEEEKRQIERAKEAGRKGVEEGLRRQKQRGNGKNSDGKGKK